MKKVSVVILNWNGVELMKRFLPSVVAHTPPEIAEVVVADNGSDDGSLAWLKEAYPDVKIVALDRNYGFAGGYNKALEQVETPYYLLLNSDVEVKEDYVTPLLRVLESDKEVAVVMPKIRSQREPEFFEYAGAAGGFVDRFYYPYCHGRVLDSVERDNGQYDTPSEVFWASGAAFLVRADLYRSFGGFDDDFFAHCEEIDLCWRLKRAGYKVMYEPMARVFHLGGGTLDNASPRKLFYNFRNSLFMIHKNAPSGRLFGALVGRMCFDGAIAAYYLLQRKPSYFAAVFRAHVHYYKSRKSLKAKRRKLLSQGVSERSLVGRSKRVVAFSAIKK